MEKWWAKKNLYATHSTCYSLPDIKCMLRDEELLFFHDTWLLVPLFLKYGFEMGKKFLLLGMNSKTIGQHEKEKSSRCDARSTNKQTIMEKQVNTALLSSVIFIISSPSYCMSFRIIIRFSTALFLLMSWYISENALFCYKHEQQLIRYVHLRLITSVVKAWKSKV